MNEIAVSRRCVPLWYTFAYYTVNFAYSIGNYNVTSPYAPGRLYAVNSTENLCTATAVFYQTLAINAEVAKSFQVVYARASEAGRARQGTRGPAFTQ